ncbi:DEAD/DEAH box helicase [Nostocoides sp. F2B08]|uniref:DEAD/DEAH box helicase n=1 Tax=Nostocoides sp. F2B08 TaxID=2653936 RepID=UPI0012632340|nr:DEAD/DEAH box helicase [Tetrasphaera sp. F2B08]KAB7743223.1 DEAD/DEAH box helicase [Tetrasphaera sp. F2B08]
MARPPKKSAGKKTDTAGAPKKARWTPAQKAAAKKLKAAGGPKKPHRKGGSTAAASTRDERREPREYQKREDRPYRARDERPRGERSDYRSRDDRGGDRREYRSRDDRGDYRQRDDRRDYRSRDDRTEYRRRDDRDDYRRRDDRRDDRGGYRRDDRGDYRRRDDRRDDRGGYRRDDRGDYRRRDDRRDDRGGRDDRRDYRGRDDRRPDTRGREDAPPTWEEAEAERAEADTYVRYSGARASGPAKVTDDNGFAAMGLPMVLVERLARDGITEPFAIQATTIPDALAGRDVLGRAQTGSGKTLGFGLPLLTRLMGSKSKPRRPRAIVLVPTRELAMQVNDALEPLAVASGLRCRLVAGGLSYTGQISALDRGVDVLIATPGRLKDLREREAVDFGDVEVTVLDEADHMADMGFMVDVSTILDEIPNDGQRLLFSATLDNGVDQVVDRYLTDPVEHGVDDVGASVETMSHFVFLVGPQDKKTVTAELANRTTRTIVFVRTKLGADRVAGELQDRGIRAAALHGGLTQSVRNRVLGAFREGRLPVLVATDVAARGIHVDDVSLVLQVDPPADHKDYLHRSGRTARAGELGTVVTLALPHQRRTMERMIASAGLDISPVSVRPGDPLIDAAGGSTPPGVSVAEEVAAILAPKHRGHRRGHPARTPGGGGRPRFGKGGRSGERRPRQDRRGDR